MTTKGFPWARVSPYLARICRIVGDVGVLFGAILHLALRLIGDREGALMGLESMLLALFLRRVPDDILDGEVETDT